LVALGIMVGIVILSGVATAQVALALIGLYATAFILSTLQVQPTQLIDRSRASLTAARMSPEAREATDRARRRGTPFNNGLALSDVGLVVTQSSREGIVMRRSRSVTGDDDGARPYITLRVQPSQADRHVLIRFEMIDQKGETRYVHEMRSYLRDGENSILADHHLPLASSGQALPAGDWDLRVFVDGNLVGLHGFAFSPSVRDRFRYLEDDSQAPAAQAAAAPRAARRLQADDDSQDVPKSLEELLRAQSKAAHGQNGRSQPGTRG